MEGVGARFGRSSTRYGPTSTVFSGPVRKWKKKWVHVAPPPAATATAAKYSQSNGSTNAVSNGSNGASHLLFYKWAPINNTSNSNNNDSATEDGAAGDSKEEEEDDVVEPPRRKFRYIPVAVLEEQQIEAAENEAEEKVEDETNPNDANPDAVDLTSKNDVLDEKPDINDVPMEEAQDADDAPSTRQDLKKNMSFNLNSNDGDPESDTNADEE